MLRSLRDRVPAPLAAHLGAQLPLIVRGAYYDGYHPNAEPMRLRSQAAFLAHVEQGLHGIRPVDARDAVCSVFGVLSAHLPRGQCVKVRDALPDDLKALWQIDDANRSSVEEQAAAGRAAQNAADARAFRTRSSGGTGKRRKTSESGAP